jgi:hypothetical protein
MEVGGNAFDSQMGVATSHDSKFGVHSGRKCNNLISLRTCMKARKLMIVINENKLSKVPHKLRLYRLILPYIYRLILPYIYRLILPYTGICISTFACNSENKQH